MWVGDFELTEEMITKVIYGMENQGEELYLNLVDGQLTNEYSDSKYVVPLPPWHSRDGYFLMLNFTKHLPEIPARKRLLSVLKSGMSVYRGFKDVISEYPQVLSLWENYKYQKMKKLTISHFSGTSEAMELEALGKESDEWNEISRLNFSVRLAGREDRDDVRCLYKQGIDEMESRNKEFASFLYGLKAENEDSLLEERTQIYLAEDIAGNTVALSLLLSDGWEVPAICFLYVIRECRSAGVEHLILNHVSEDVKKSGISELGVWMYEGQHIDELFQGCAFQRKFAFWSKKI